MPTSVCTARASYKKIAGSLELTDSHLQWTQDGKKAPSVRVPYSEAASLFCSKEGAAQVRLKLGLLNDETGHNFTFISPPPVAYTERERFKKELTTIISRNRASQDVKPPVAAVTPAFVSTPSTPLPAVVPPPPSVSRAASVSSDRRSTPVIPGNDPTSDFRLRKKVLIGNPELGQLHRDLVMSGQITEAEFWDGREHLLLAEAAAESQKRGKPGQLVDPRPETVDGGEIKIRITPQLVHDIFDEYPVVARAYSENVPSKLTEESFWKRYFQSKLFHAHRASIRSTAAQHVVKDDPIFDQYLEKEDDELEPRRQRDEAVDPFVDLGATQADHETEGNEKDITMQAGRQKAALPLIRKFNEHSERLLRSALGEGPPTKRQRLNTAEDAYAQIELDDLRNPEASTGVILDMQDRQRYFEGRMLSSAVDAAVKNLDIPAVILEAKGNVEGWARNLMQLKQERKSGDAALNAMSDNVKARLEVRSRKSPYPILLHFPVICRSLFPVLSPHLRPALTPHRHHPTHTTDEIPDGLFRQMTTCQTAANEFLRQFWSAVYPPPMELQTVMVATPAQRATKAAKMIGYLAKTREKVDALVKVAEQHGVDKGSVETAFRAVLNAVDRAIAFHQRKTATTRPSLEKQ
ncbi:putative TFIIH p62 subunit, N-terminal domain [Lyophyllum shimeji]|uniref:TFIIH p62 subunit, N-terminal domain n=1 Tax=Lyophyllum shimeji TaxID=47721 RepID=A0A9P3UN91_LYOSH|nr:putative TFIIH p62 subunit, N-terminal domain [Lyophyllum shimeji]